VQIGKSEMVEFAEIVAQAVVKALDGKSVSANPKPDKTAYQKCEQLLYNYNGFKRIVDECSQEIKDIKLYGVPQKSAMSGGERVQSSRNVQGIVLPEESVEQAVRNVQESVRGTVQAIALIDKCMNSLRNDPYYDVLPMRYFEGRTLEDIGVCLGYDHSTISRNKNRLVKELSMRLFPDEVVSEMMQ
jgi:hypothetical protein